MNNETNIDVQYVSPLKKILMTIGELPTSYLETMSYYEMLVWFTEFLRNQVIPTVNNNAEAVEELQDLYEELKTYVNTYFENLDIQEEINNKLDEMAEDGSLTSLIAQYINPIYQSYENEINGIVENQNNNINTFKNQVNSEISVIDTKVNQATSGSPLVASSTSGMTNTERVYVNTSDGYWYYYDGDSWERGGVYQAITNDDLEEMKFSFDNHLYESAHESVTSSFNKFIQRSDNLFDKTQIVSGKYLDITNGNVSNHTTSQYNAQYIPVLAETTYYIYNNKTGLRVCYYDSDLSFVSGETFAYNASSLTTPADVSYMRLNYYAKSFDNNFMVSATNLLDTTFKEYMKVKENLIPLTEETKTLVNSNIDHILKSTDNLFDDFYIVNGYYLNPSNGEVLQSASSQYCSQYIPVIAETNYYFNDRCYILYYDRNFNYLSGNDSLSNRVITTPQNAAYVRIAVYQHHFNNFMFMDSTLPTSYVPYRYFNNDYYSFNPHDIDRLKMNQTQLIKNLYFKNVYIDHLFINLIASESQIIGAESLDNIRIAKRLGFKITEASIHKTSDNKYIVLHGDSGKFGTEVSDLDGTDQYKNTAINSVTLEWIKENIRYRSTIAKFRTPIPTFEEWLNECKVLQMIPYFACDTEEVAEIANKIMGKGNYITWRGNRDYVDGLITLSAGDNITAQNFIDSCETVDVPVATGIGLSEKTDEELKTIIDALHNKGYLVLWNSCYSTVEDTQRALKLGFDLSTSGWDIPDFESGNLCNLTGDDDYSDFITSGTNNGGILSLSNNQTITPNVTLPSPFLSGGSLYINFIGTIHIKLGDFIDTDITSDGKQTNWFSTYFINETPTFTITASGSVTVNNIVYKASKF